ncbi:hypothetical protein BAY61_22415 [Prauserella marina]|uniref:DNA-binding transcriptional activator of the SARP family n=1 Tax=Prauserella marina TaxID=530584 RepID=A0A222VTN5_9PSEU|nr:AfsR/SARP family transcriptional regulator [Prauserella marina]ASR37295.1 hypothetical protein BAY61_22415 [Prauserella marina]PWV72634.1 DNA-binding SARP family transcriptional activator [Prauserella marina]SDD75528.1 DNA-binding transcriptional activator of the SARP family [Prauserella marina]
MSGPAGLRFSVLGPVRVEREGAPVPVTAPMQRAVIAVLLSRDRAPVPTAAIAGELWGGAPPSSAKVTIRNYIRRLRSLLPDGTLVSTHSGYQLVVSPRQVDATLLAGLGERAHVLADTSPAAAVEHARQALALWEGPPLLGIGDVPLRAWWGPRLEESYLPIAELSFELELRLGRAARLVPELARVHAEFPRRERIGALLMLALYHSGRAAEAIACFRRMRATIITTSGVEPGPRLRELQQAILRGDTEALAVDRVASPVTVAKGKAVPLPPPPVHVVGRDDVLAELGGHFDALRESEGAALTCLLHGQAGVGKSAVALRAAARFADRFPGGVAYLDLGGVDSAGVLASLAGQLGIEAEADDLASRYRARLRERPVLLVLDNAGSLSQVAAVLPSEPGCAAIVTSRSPSGGPSSAPRVPVEPLSDVESVDLLARLIGTRAVSAEPRHALGMARLCGGLPLALRVLGARAAANPHWSLAAWEELLGDERGRLAELCHDDMDMRTSLEAGLGGDSAAAWSLFDLLGALPSPEYTPALAAALTGVPLTGAERTLRTLADARLVFSPSPGRYRFHDLTGVLARERASSLPHGEMADALSRAGRWYLAAVRRVMERLSGPRSPYGLPEGRSVAALDPVSFDSVREARNWLAAEIGPIVEVFTALTAHRERGAAELAPPLVHALAPYFDLTLRWGERERLAARVLALAETGRPELEPVALTQFADIERQRGNHAEALRLAKRAETLAEAEFDKVTALLSQSAVLVLTRDVANAERTCRKAADIAVAHGYSRLEAAALANLALVHQVRGEPDNALILLEKSDRIHRDDGNLLGRIGTANLASSVHEERGDRHAVLRRAMTLLPLCEELGDGYGTAECRARTARSLRALGREAEAAEHAARAREVIEAIGARERIVPVTLFDAIGIPEGG